MNGGQLLLRAVRDIHHDLPRETTMPDAASAPPHLPRTNSSTRSPCYAKKSVSRTHAWPGLQRRGGRTTCPPSGSPFLELRAVRGWSLATTASGRPQANSVPIRLRISHDFPQPSQRLDQLADMHVGNALLDAAIQALTDPSACSRVLAFTQRPPCFVKKIK